MPAITEFLLASAIVDCVSKCPQVDSNTIGGRDIGLRIGGGVAFRQSLLGTVIYAIVCILTVFTVPLVLLIIARSSSTEKKCERYVSLFPKREPTGGMPAEEVPAAVAVDELASSPLAAAGPAGDERVIIFVEEDVAAAATVQGAASNGTPLPQQSAGGSSVSSSPASAPMRPQGAAAGSPLAPPAQGGSASLQPQPLVQPQPPTGSGGAAGQPAAVAAGGRKRLVAKMVSRAEAKELGCDPSKWNAVRPEDVDWVDRELFGRFIAEHEEKCSDPAIVALLSECARHPDDYFHDLGIYVDARWFGCRTFDSGKDLFDKDLLYIGILRLSAQLKLKDGWSGDGKIQRMLNHMLGLYYMGWKYLVGASDETMFKYVVGTLERRPCIFSAETWESIDVAENVRRLVSRTFGEAVSTPPDGSEYKSISVAKVLLNHIKLSNPGAFFLNSGLHELAAGNKMIGATAGTCEFGGNLYGVAYFDCRRGVALTDRGKPMPLPTTDCRVPLDSGRDVSCGAIGLGAWGDGEFSLISHIANFAEASASPTFRILMWLTHELRLFYQIGNRRDLYGGVPYVPERRHEEIGLGGTNPFFPSMSIAYGAKSAVARAPDLDDGSGDVCDYVPLTGDLLIKIRDEAFDGLRKAFLPKPRKNKGSVSVLQLEGDEEERRLAESRRAGGGGAAEAGAASPVDAEADAGGDSVLLLQPDSGTPPDDEVRLVVEPRSADDSGDAKASEISDVDDAIANMSNEAVIEELKSKPHRLHRLAAVLEELNQLIESDAAIELPDELAYFRMLLAIHYRTDNLGEIAGKESELNVEERSKDGLLEAVFGCIEEEGYANRTGGNVPFNGNVLVRAGSIPISISLPWAKVRELIRRGTAVKDIVRAVSGECDIVTVDSQELAALLGGENCIYGAVGT
ncbi:MAG: hypothetical protein LBI39_03960 [Puniceicoccales bacterium]|nr:hypothetical protein [Puniceicoccales bacterium]